MTTRPEDDDVTRLLAAAARGDEQALPRATEIVYQQLREIAHRARRGRSSHQTLRTTALVNEAYVRLVNVDGADWDGRSHFLGVAARAMRSILVDHARARSARKRGAGHQRVPLDDVLDELDAERVDVLALNEALGRLAALDERKARVVELRYFAGADIARVAELLGVGHATVERDWKFARAWLQREMKGATPDDRAARDEELQS